MKFKMLKHTAKNFTEQSSTFKEDQGFWNSGEQTELTLNSIPLRQKVGGLLSTGVS